VITFWLICAIMIGIALAFMLPTLLERSKDTDETQHQEAREANIEVYRDQLNELEGDLRNGVIGSELYQQDRDELERRLLEDVTATSVLSKSSSSQGRGVVYAVALGLPALAIALYLQVGSPKASTAAPGSSQIPAAGGDFSQARIEQNVAALAKRLEENPNDLEGWMMLARSYASLEKYNEASSAYAKATALKTDDAELWADYAFALGMAQGQKLAGQPTDLIDKALKLDPENPKALDLAGSAAFEAADYKRAVDYWERLSKKVPANSELGRALAEKIDEARKRTAK
jgi:cytochrome c-type biogenesis protein CcmH